MLVTALATPFYNGRIDRASYERLLNFQSERGVDALLAAGTTAEALSLNPRERKLLIALAVATNLPVWAGVENSDVRQAAREAQTARDLGATGILLAPPHFVKCTPKGYVRYALAVKKAAKLPLMLYNVPSRCGYVLDEQALDELAEETAYLKDAGNDLAFTLRRKDKTTVLCGNDCLLSQMTVCGAKGAVSVVSNVAPLLTRAVLEKGESALFGKLAALSAEEINPIAVKYMLYKAKIFHSYEMRLPLTEATRRTRQKIDKLNWEVVK